MRTSHPFTGRYTMNGHRRRTGRVIHRPRGPRPERIHAGHALQATALFLPYLLLTLRNSIRRAA
jgi:hypothetical protein